MPQLRGETAVIKRCQKLLAALTADYQHRDELLLAVGDYPENEESASRMLRGDLETLRRLGFIIERATEHHAPYYRVVRHARFGHEVRVKYCSRCDQWRPLDDFGADRSRKSKKAIYCRLCQKAQSKESHSKPENYERRREGIRRWIEKNPERAREYQRAYYERNKERIKKRQRAHYQKKKEQG